MRSARPFLQTAAYALLVWLLSTAWLLAQVRPGTVQGVVSTQGGTVLLPGAEVVVNDSAGKPVAQVLTLGDGHFTVPNLPPGQYVVVASLPGFTTRSSPVAVKAGATTELIVDLPIGLSASVDVVATSPVVGSEGSLVQGDAMSGKELEQFAPTGGIQASLKLLASIIEVPGGLSIKGGLPSQAGFQLGAGTLVDPSTGLTHVTLPDDAIDSVSVLPNPYAVEFGRFSSGLVVVQTRRATDEWKVRVNNVDPTFRTSRNGSPVDITGLGWWAPRMSVGGPIIKDKLWIEQSAQYWYRAADVPSRPEDELRISKSFSSFTRVDANLSPRHTLVASGGFFPGSMGQLNLGTFTPPAATVNQDIRAGQFAVTERTTWGDHLFGETTLQGNVYHADLFPQGTAPMIIGTESTGGNFFNQERRNTSTFQVIESIAGSHEATGGQHLFKVGFDALYSGYDGTSTSRPVEIYRYDGTLARRLDFSPLTTHQSIGTSDIALFAQDRYQRGSRWYVEFGTRLDRDGVVERFNFTPRIGTAVLLNESGTATLRGGYGLFYERTPSIAGAFNEFEPYVDTRYAADGVTPLGPGVTYTQGIARDLKTSVSRTWDIRYDHRLNSSWSFHAGAIEREGINELIVAPVQTSATTGQILLSSAGSSSYKEAEFGFRFKRDPHVDLNFSYVRSSAKNDLNALTNYFDSVRQPVIGVNEYTVARTDAPNRVVVRGRLMPTDKWLLLGFFDWRNGLPYSAVNEMLDFVGPRNSLRFPNYLRLEVGLERRVRLLGLEPWVGVRVWNALESFLPTDVQANTGSPHFGSFYSSEYRQFRIQVRFER